MDSTGDPERESSARRCGPAASSRMRGGERKGAPATQPDVCPALSDRYHARLPVTVPAAGLPTGDGYAAAAVLPAVWGGPALISNYQARVPAR